SPVPRLIARWTLSCGMLTSRAFSNASRSRYLPSGFPPPSRAAMVISRAILVNCWPFLASVRAFLCLIEDHLEWPDIVSPSERLSHLQPDDSMKSTLQHHIVDRDELVIGRTYRLAIDPEALLPDEPPRLVL